MLAPADDSAVSAPAIAASLLDHDAIAALIPHGEKMCLLQRIVGWDQRSIRCIALSHRDTDNPLREAGGLPVWAGIEYAAQAAAVHGALMQPQAAPRTGVLAALRNVSAACEWLHLIDGELMLSVNLLHADAAGGIYGFEIHGNDTVLLQGQFTLMFAAGAQEGLK